MTKYIGARVEENLKNEFKVGLIQAGLTQQEFIELAVKGFINGELDLPES